MSAPGTLVPVRQNRRVSYDELITHLTALAPGTFVDAEIFPAGTDLRDAEAVGRGTVASFSDTLARVAPTAAGHGYRVWFAHRGPGPGQVLLAREQVISIERDDPEDQPQLWMLLIATIHASVRLTIYR